MDDMNKKRDLLGSRVIDEDEHKGTVLFHGIVQGYKGTWLGIDWDEGTRGKHDGTVNNIAYFTSKSPTSGSFVRPNKMHFGVSLMEAVRERYGQVDLSDLPVGCMIGNKEIELVGMEKSLNKTKDASKLLCIVLDGLRVSEAGVIGDELKCCREIDLNNNVIADWNQVLAILKQVKRLNFMNISKNLINNLRSGNHEKCVFPNLETFLMHYADLDWEDVCIILEHLPGIRDLGVSHNRISHLSISSQNLDNLAILDLEANPIKCWNNLKALFTLPKLVSLNLNESQISEVKYVSGSFPALKILFLRNCLLTSWQSLAELSKLGSLEHLLVHGNPIITAQSIATSKQIVIATMPRLLILDREHITQSERRGAEIDYLKRYAKEWLTLSAAGDSAGLQQFYQTHQTYLNLINLHGPPEESELGPINATMQSKIIRAKISLSNGRIVEKGILKSMTVAKLKTLVARLDRRRDPRSFTLKFIPANKPGLEVELDREFREVDFYSLADNDTIYIDETIIT